MTLLYRIQQRHLTILQQNVETLANIFQSISPDEATTYRDGPQGWTSLEVLCHLRDYDIFYQQQAEMLLTEESPTMPIYDHEALAIERRYNVQSIEKALNDLKQSRQQAIDFYKNLTDNQWQRVGHHPFFGEWSMTDNLTFIS